MEAVAREAGMSLTGYSRIEHGEINQPHYVNVIRVCRVLGVDPEDIGEFRVPEYDPMVG